MVYAYAFLSPPLAPNVSHYDTWWQRVLKSSRGQGVDIRMGPKKHTALKASDEAQDELSPGQRGASSSPQRGNGEGVEELTKMLQSFMQTQQAREDHLDKEAHRQEHRWRALQHQFTQLQTEIQWQRPNQLALGVVTVQDSSLPSTAAAPRHRIIRHTQDNVQGAQGIESAQDASTGQWQGPSCMGWQGPKILPLQEDEDIEHYLTTFERIAQAWRWPREDWALHLVPLLTGKASAAYVAMDIADTLDYNLVKRAVLFKYEINAEIYRQRFRTNLIQEGESPRELQARLKDLYEKWMTPGQRTKEEIGDVIILEQFLKVLNPKIRTWIKEHNPSSSRQAAELADTFIAARLFSYQLGYTQGRSGSTSGKSGVGCGSGHVFNTSKALNIHTPQVWSTRTQESRVSSTGC